ncbi:NHL repeat containing protein [Thermincola potens JR]|uniref:NHL repeat containing protein n=1 Tax=Thermincola potens (strain JR) TaxID=635013 RepID=D5XD23_THEPJ|nr:NHL repeat containing protein [Thermincola potens JR]
MVKIRGLSSGTKKVLFLLPVLVIFFAALAVVKFLSGPETITYTAVQPYGLIAGPPDRQLSRPTAVAVGLRGQVYIADAGNKQVVVIEEDGRYSLRFGMPGSGLAEMGRPVSIDVSPNGNVYVADEEKRAVLVFNSEGEYLYTIDGKEEGAFAPVSVQTDSDGRVYVFDKAENRLRVFSSAGKKIKEFPPVQIKGLRSISYAFYNSEDESLFVLGPGLPGFGIWKNGKGSICGRDRLVDPRGIAFNRSRRVIMISDGYKNKVVVFSNAGKYLGEFGGPGNGMGDFNTPAGLAFDERGKLYVADRDNNRVTVYALE